MFRNEVHGVPNSRLETLRRLPMFEQYSDEELIRVDSLVYETTLPAGALLTIEGKVRRQAFIILSGEATVAVGGQVIGRVSHGDLVGEMSLVNHGPQMATVTAEGPLRVLVMDPREFGTWLSDPRAARWLAGDLSEKQASTYRPATAPKPVRVPA